MVNAVYFTDMFKIYNVLYIHKSNDNLGLFTHRPNPNLGLYTHKTKILTLVYMHKPKANPW